MTVPPPSLVTGLVIESATVAAPVKDVVTGRSPAPRAVLSRKRTVALGVSTFDVSVATVNVHEAVGAMVMSTDPDTQVPPVTMKLLGEGTVVNELLAMTSGLVPMLVTITVWELGAPPTATVPKSWDVGESRFSAQPTVELNRTSPLSTGAPPSQCCTNEAANDARVPVASTVRSSIVNEPVSALQPRPSPNMSRPGCPGVRDTVRTALVYEPTANAWPGGAAKSVFHHQAGDGGSGAKFTWISFGAAFVAPPNVDVVIAELELGNV